MKVPYVIDNRAHVLARHTDGQLVVFSEGNGRPGLRYWRIGPFKPSVGIELVSKRRAWFAMKPGEGKHGIG